MVRLVSAVLVLVPLLSVLRVTSAFGAPATGPSGTPATAPATRPAVDPALLTRYAARTLASAAVPGGSLNYRLLVPDGYDPMAAAAYPLLLQLHGAGERGTDNARQLIWGGAQLATKLQAAGPCFVVAPQCPPGKQWVNTPWAKGSYSTAAVPISDELKMAIEAVEKAAVEFKIDRSRIYVMGLSMGGYGTWDAIARRPDLFAAAVPICGGGDPAAAARLKAIPIRVFHGGADPVVPPAASRDMAAALKAAGATDATLTYTEFPGVAHNAWTPAWETPGLFEWLLAQKRR
ncbi:MAG: alpha/beta hydrolase [Phycisphaerales bacterium]|nr:alpha/beta hydrolase [Phycisphaerales bacterium]